MPEPGSKAYDTERARLRKDFEDQGLPDAKANERANAALQGDVAASQTEPRSRRDDDETRRGHGRGSG
ncbi:MAG: hypothetical protein ABR520_09490 [Mycobacteriales bacterium]|nr:hypothetical protein [Frankia sp.]